MASALLEDTLPTSAQPEAGSAVDIQHELKHENEPLSLFSEAPPSPLDLPSPPSLPPSEDGSPTSLGDADSEGDITDTEHDTYFLENDHTIIEESIAFREAEDEDIWDEESIEVYLPMLAEGSFGSLDTLRAVLGEFTTRHGYHLVILRSKRNKANIKNKVVLACDRHPPREGRNYRRLTEQSRKRENPSYRGTGCRFMATARLESDTDTWRYAHETGRSMHNHPPSTHPGAHPHYRALQRKQIATLIEMNLATGVSIAQTIAQIREVDPKLVILAKDISNERQRRRIVDLAGHTAIETLLSSFEASGTFSRVFYDEERRLQRLFLSFQESIEIFKKHPDVIVLDCTYKTNRYGLALLNAVGITGMRTTIHIAQVLMDQEDESAYVWALSQLKELLIEFDVAKPQLFATDRDLALINALEATFREIPAILCLWHVVKAVETHAREHEFPRVPEDPEDPDNLKKMDSKDHRVFCDQFYTLVRSQTEAAYLENLQVLRDLCPSEAVYIEEVWLDIFKERIVHCFTNKILHFGIISTSRVEGYHAVMKRWLQTSRGDMTSIYTRIQLWTRNSNNAHVIALANAQISIPRDHLGHCFERITSIIHRAAIRKSNNHFRVVQAAQQEGDLSPCTGVFSRTMGLPCGHKLLEHDRNKKPLLPTDFHAHWWIDRLQAPPPPPQGILEPLSVAEKRELRKQQRQGQRAASQATNSTRLTSSQPNRRITTGRGGRGAGAHGTRLPPLAFERSEAQIQRSQPLPTPNSHLRELQPLLQQPSPFSQPQFHFPQSLHTPTLPHHPSPTPPPLHYHPNHFQQHPYPYNYASPTPTPFRHPYSPYTPILSHPLQPHPLQPHPLQPHPLDPHPPQPHPPPP